MTAVATLLVALFVGSVAAAQPASPERPPGIVHGYAYFPSGSAVRHRPEPFDPLTHLAVQVPPDAYVMVQAKTDTLGDDEANFRLSLRRAQAVADELVALGVRAERITLRACGERDLNRPTPDGVSEPLNRSVFFDWRDTPWPASLNCEQLAYRP